MWGHVLSLGGGARTMEPGSPRTTSRRLGLLAYIVLPIAPALSCYIRFAGHVLVCILDGSQQRL